MADETTTPIDTASAAALAQKGKTVRTTALVPTTSYVMTRWFKSGKVFSLVTFQGYGLEHNTLLDKIPQLKGLDASHKFWFIENGVEIEVHGANGAVLIGEGENEVRATFATLLLNEPAESPATPLSTDELTDALARQAVASETVPTELEAV
jgi:hypothetical protein